MIKWLFPKIIGGKTEREVSRIRPAVARINEIEAALQLEPSEKLRQLTAGWQSHLARYHPLNAAPRALLEQMDEEGLLAAGALIESRLSLLRKEFPSLPRKVEASVSSIETAKAAFHQIEERFGKSRSRYLETILPDAYAVVKNAARRLCGSEFIVSGHAVTWDMIHFDVQLLGGIAVHRGMIAEMQTGEGKTLVATLPVYLNALTGLGVHVVTVNDYLAKRDSEWMGALLRSLGLSVGCIENQMSPAHRRLAYACDITYGSNSEFGFDFLRDNGMATTTDEQVQRGHYLAIIDEVDSVLIDDARTPLIITGAASQATDEFQYLTPIVEQLVKRQTELCNHFAAEAKRLLDEGNAEAAGLTLLKLKLGQPRNRQFRRFMEDPEVRRLLERAEVSSHHGTFQKEIYALKAELYFAVDEKRNDADLMEKGRAFLSPSDPDAFTVPDIAPLFAAIDSASDLTPERRAADKRDVQARLDAQARNIHGVSQLLKAFCLYERDVHYVVRDGKVAIIDESTGREMAGRRWSDGLHQAVEAKERVSVEKDSQTYATITIQNYFRLYEKLAGMTGTAETEAAEFHQTYQLDVLPIPTNAPNIRIDENDQIFKTRREKFNAVIEKIRRAHTNGQPVLVGTASVESSETLSRMLKRAKIAHSVLNAKFHEQEADIVALAGQRGAVTVSTNMAGRGTDIKLGEGVAALGGLFVIGTERHQSRRVDRQLRGRCSRQGDPGRSQFFISLEDDLMRNHASPTHMAAMIEQSGKSRRSSSLGALVENAQRQVEQRDYKSRKQVLDFDDVMNRQREIIYTYRNEVLTTEDTRGMVHEMVGDAVLARVQEHFPDNNPLLQWIQTTLPVSISAADLIGQDPQSVTAHVVDKVLAAYASRTAGLPREALSQGERRMLLIAIDQHWQEHLTDLDELREGVYLRAQGQKDPLVEYKNEGFELFSTLMDSIKQDALKNLFRSAASIEAFLAQFHGELPEEGMLKLNLPANKPTRPPRTPGRNAACTCGSGKKFKQCCGRFG
jgi:preprotein translocase subunit SecA